MNIIFKYLLVHVVIEGSVESFLFFVKYLLKCHEKALSDFILHVLERDFFHCPFSDERQEPTDSSCSVGECKNASLTYVGYNFLN